MAEVNFRNASKTFPGEIRAVDKFALSVRDGEFLVLVGPSGCGKTTILRMLAGLETVTDGEILLDGKLVNDLDPGDRDLSMVFQNYALFPHLNVFDNMAFGLRARRYSKNEIQQRISEVAARLGLSDLLKRKPAALSGGQRQRVALGRAIARKPKVYLMDEPLSNLDAQLRLAMRKELSLLRNELGVTTIYVTHDQAEALTLGNRICVMHEGRIQQVGTPEETYNQPANQFVAGFLGNPPMNFIEGTLQREGTRFTFLIGNQRALLPSGLIHTSFEQGKNASITLGIRPEHVSICPQKVSEDELCLEVELEHREWQGDHVLLHLKGNFGPLVAKAKVSKLKDMDDESRLEVGLALADCQFFGGPDNRNLTLKRNPQSDFE